MAQWAVEQWAGFPVDQEPRALVFTGPIVLPERGFKTGEAKIAFLRGHIEVRGPVPEDVISLLRAQGSPEGHHGPAVSPLILSDATKSDALFSTDRGQRILPTWRFVGEELLGGLDVLDPEIARTQWTRPEPPSASTRKYH